MELGSSADDVRTSVHRHHHEEDEDLHNKEPHFHVLAVDDSIIDRKLLERLLTVSSYQVTCVDSGDKALEYLGLVGIEEKECEYSSLKHSHQEVSKINMIMTDYSMPGITGYDLLKKIKGSPWKNVPVVVMSSENVPSRINMCLEGGAEEFLLKPVKPSDLEKLHSNLLKHSHPFNDGGDRRRHSSVNEDNGGITGSPLQEMKRLITLSAVKRTKEAMPRNTAAALLTLTRGRRRRRQRYHRMFRTEESEFNNCRSLRLYDEFYI